MVDLFQFPEYIYAPEYMLPEYREHHQGGACGSPATSKDSRRSPRSYFTTWENSAYSRSTPRLANGRRSCRAKCLRCTHKASCVGRMAGAKTPRLRKVTAFKVHLGIQAGTESLSLYAFKTLQVGPRKPVKIRQAVSQESDEKGVAKPQEGSIRGFSCSSADNLGNTDKWSQFVLDSSNSGGPSETSI